MDAQVAIPTPSTKADSHRRRGNEVTRAPEGAVLSVQGIRTGYGQSTVIENLSLEVAPGEIVGVLGLNGMGKSTLMRALIGLLPLTGGEVTLGGQPLSRLPAHQRVRAGLGYVPQGRMVFPKLTVEENILAGARHPKLGVPAELYEYFPVLKEMRKRRGGNLSGGQQQQLVIARALAAEPRVLLLDEPTEGIQPSIIKELAAVLKRIREKRGLSLLVSEQVLSFALDLVDRVLVMERGAIVHDSPRDAVDEAEVARMLSL